MIDRFTDCLTEFTWLPHWDGQPYHVTQGDPGGPTAWGVTLGVYAAWRRAHGKMTTVAHDLQVAQKAELSELTRALYWAPIYADKLPVGVDLLVYDFGFGSGPGTSARVLQQMLHVAADGYIGPATIAAAAKVQDHAGLLHDLAAAHVRYYSGLSNWTRFGKGWAARNTARLALACQMAGLKAQTVPVPAVPVTPSDDAATDALNAAQLAGHA